MEPTLRNGEYVLCNELSLMNMDKLHHDNIYVICLRKGVYIKRVHINKKVLVLISDNANYPPIEILIKDIEMIFKVELSYNVL